MIIESLQLRKTLFNKLDMNRYSLSFVFFLLALLFFHSVQFPTMISHDVSINLSYGQLVYAGATPYIDYFDTNPPLIFFISAIPVIISNTLGTTIATSSHLFITLLCCYAALFPLWLARKAPSEQQRQLFIVVSIWLLASVYTWYGFPSLKIEDMPDCLASSFGQREHIFLLTLLPYSILRWLRAGGTKVSHLSCAAGGFIAAIGICIKPPFLLIVFLQEIVLLIYLFKNAELKKFINTEVFFLALGGAAYVAHFFILLTEEARDSLFNRWIPFLFQGYLSYSVSRWTLVQQVPVITAAIIAVIILVRGISKSTYTGLLSRQFAAGTIGGLIFYVMQAKGWDYHKFPYTFFTLAAVALVLSNSINSITSDSALFAYKKKLIYPGRVLLVLALIGLLLRPVYASFKAEYNKTPSEQLLEPIFNMYSEKGDTILVFATSVGMAYPITVTTERKMGSRYHFLVSLVMYYQEVKKEAGKPFPYHTIENAPKGEKQLLTELEEDLAHFRPKLIFIDGIQGEYCQACPEGFSVADYFEKSGFIDKAMSNYKEVDLPEFWPKEWPARLFILKDS